jgi:hypothetical protein
VTTARPRVLRRCKLLYVEVLADLETGQDSTGTGATVGV